PLVFLRRLAAIIPPPRKNQIRFHGVFAPHSKFNAKTKTLVPTPEITKAKKPVLADELEIMDAKQRGYRMLWSELLMRVFQNDVLACPKCGGRLRLVALIKEPKALRKICEHLGFPTELPKPAPARPPPQMKILVTAATVICPVETRPQDHRLRWKFWIGREAHSLNSDVFQACSFRR
ncbi:MAG: hypothetical protein V1754_03035, partial [Pseudomonadota bacterium]